MVAFVTSLIVAFIIVGGIVAYQKRRPAGQVVTWGEAMFGSMVVFFLMFWVYGVVPHQWLTWADNELGWRPDNIVYGPFDILKPQAVDGWLPMTITYQTVRDIIAVLLYVVFLVAQVWAWIWWQNRGKRAAAAETAAASVTSEFGRPLVRKG